jgi:hypothetical protein
MGAWGAGTFENDDAADWLADLCDGPNQEALAEALAAVAGAGADEYLEAPDCSAGLAAAEFVAALKGAPGADLPDEARACAAKLETKADPGLVSLALRAVERVRADSELKELWDESEDPAEWYAAVGDLEARLKQ